MPRGVERIGPYRLLEPIGAGAMGMVYRASHDDSGEICALKTVRVPRQGLLASIRREVHALSRLRHPGVVRIVDHGVADGLPWYAMELIEGVPLRRTVGGSASATMAATQLSDPGPAAAPAATVAAAGGPLPRPRLLRLVRRLCAPLAYLHGEGIVHRDLKPDNVIVRGDDWPVIVNFGLVAQVGADVSREALAAAGSTGGTTAYVAPEQLRHLPADPRADLYSLGCILFELLTGSPPFVGRTALEVLDGHLHGTPVPPSRLVDGVPRELDDLVLSLLAKEPRRRLGHAGVVAAALAAAAPEDPPDPPAPPVRAYLYRPALAGRDEVVEAVERGLDAAAEAGGGGRVLIAGESGIGKTRLALEVAQRAERRGVAVFTGECAPGAAPLEALRGFLRAVADRCRELGREETDRLLGARGRLLAPYEPALAGLPGLDAWPEPEPDPDGDSRRPVWQALAGTLAAVGAVGPALLVVDDLQWGDPLSLGFLADAAGTGRRLPPLLGLYRVDEVGPALAAVLAARAARVIRLGRLDRAAVGAMVGDMLALDEPPAALVDFLFRQSGGNPFFVAEYLRAAVAEELLHRDERGRWQVARAPATAADADVWAGLGLPGALAALVGRRIGHLSPRARALVEVAAVLGREMDGALLGVVAELGGAELLDGLSDLCAPQILEDVGDGRYRFAHDQLRELVAAVLPAPRRTALHLAAAAALRAGEPGAAALAAAARHLGAAGRDAESLSLLTEAGEKALATGAYPAGLAYLDEALGLATAGGDEAARMRLLAHRGSVRFRMGRLGEAERDLRAAQELAEARDDGPIRVSLYIDLCYLTHERGDADGALGWAERARAVAVACGDERLEMRAANALGVACHGAARAIDAIAHYRRTLAIGERLGDGHAQARALANIGVELRRLGRYDEARDEYQRSIELARSIGHRATECIAIFNLGEVYLDLDDPAAAREAFATTRWMAEELGMLGAVVEAELGLGEAALLEGDPTNAEAHARNVLELAGKKVTIGMAYRLLGKAAARRGDGAAARDWMGRSVETIRGTGLRDELALTLLALGQAGVAAGDPGAADQIDEARQIFVELGMAARFDRLTSSFCATGAGTPHLLGAQPPRGPPVSHRSAVSLVACLLAACSGGGQEPGPSPDAGDEDPSVDPPGPVDAGEPDAQSCPAGYRECPEDESCVRKNRWCDGADDCPTGEDEIDCRCGPEEFRCSDGSCIPPEWVCDGELADCPGGEEEDDTVCGGGPTDGPTCGPDCTPSGGSVTLGGVGIDGGYVEWRQTAVCGWLDEEDLGDGPGPGEACSFTGARCKLFQCECCVGEGDSEAYAAGLCLAGVCAEPEVACERALEENLTDGFFSPLCD